jgi:hypothetical protein
LFELTNNDVTAGMMNTGVNPFSTAFPSLPDPSIPLNIDDAIQQWTTMLSVLGELMLPYNGLSFLLPTVINNNLSSIRIVYYGASQF